MTHIRRPFEAVYEELVRQLLEHGEDVDTGHWQALKDVPQTQTRELTYVTIQTPILPTSGSWASATRPNLPWAEDHFQERVGGQPLNPGEQYKNWPWYRGNVEQHKQPGQFSHTYMERFWPRQAGDWAPWGLIDSLPGENAPHGIRYRYGDLQDLLNLLRREPHTRQAYLPVWFPEDTGAHHGERVPCTLGYHFMLRNDRLHCFYPIRSCDLFRHFRDDVYLAGRLVQWIIQQLVPRIGDEDEPDYSHPQNRWAHVSPGLLTMHMCSLHVFQAELSRLRKELA